MGGTVTVVVGGLGKMPPRRLARELAKTGATVETAPTVRHLADRLRAPGGGDVRGVYVVRNVVSHVAHACERGVGVAAAVGGWNGQIEIAAPLAREGRLIAVSYEDLFLRGLGWERLARFLGIAVDAPTGPVSAEAEMLDPVVLDTVTRTAAFDQYRALLGGDGTPVARRPRPAVRMYHEDIAAFDYDYQEIGARIALRRTLGQDIPEEPDVVFLGSAAVFGRFAADPFPQVVARETGLSVANFGYGGARPEVYLSDPVLMRLIERARVVVIELMSGRGCENAMLAPVGPLHNAVRVKLAYEDAIGIPNDGRTFVDRVWERAFATLPAGEVAGLIAQSAQRLEDDLAQLVARSRSAILFHLAQEPLPGVADQQHYRFPHLVTRTMAERLSRGCPFISVVSRSGVPSAITNRITGAPEPLMGGWPDPTVNAYYPSPEMHREAAAALIPLVTAASPL